MLHNENIRPSISPWNSPLIKTKDNNMRFVCDFTLQHVRVVLDILYGATYWPTLDVASAYWSILLNKAEQTKMQRSASAVENTNLT